MTPICKSHLYHFRLTATDDVYLFSITFYYHANRNILIHIMPLSIISFYLLFKNKFMSSYHFSLQDRCLKLYHYVQQKNNDERQ